MNIITNNCVGARLYQLLNCQFSNPFMWTIVLPDDFANLILNYNNIDFSAVSVIKQYWEPIHGETYGLKIDNKINVFFVHHKLDINQETPLKKGVDLYYCNIEQYLVQTWNRRLQRMNGESPHFLVALNGYWTDDDIEHYAYLTTPFKRTLVVYDKKYLGIGNSSLKTIYIENKKMGTLQIAKDLIYTCKQINYTL